MENENLIWSIIQNRIEQGRGLTVSQQSWIIGTHQILFKWDARDINFPSLIVISNKGHGIEGIRISGKIDDEE